MPTNIANIGQLKRGIYQKSLPLVRRICKKLFRFANILSINALSKQEALFNLPSFEIPYSSNSHTSISIGLFDTTELLMQH